MSRKYTCVQEYFADIPSDHLEEMEEMRKILKEALPEAEECISYNMPAYRMKHVLVYYAAMKNHLGFYPTNGPIEAFMTQLVPYSCSKGCVRFPWGEPLPKKLITEMCRYRLQEEKNSGR